MRYDPDGLHGGNANLYTYCLNDPVNFVDPFGLMGDSVPEETGREVINSVSLNPADTAGKALLGGGIAISGAIRAAAQADYNNYKNALGHLDRYESSLANFENVNWEEHGDTFEEALNNWWNVKQ